MALELLLKFEGESEGSTNFLDVSGNNRTYSASGSGSTITLVSPLYELGSLNLTGAGSITRVNESWMNLNTPFTFECTTNFTNYTTQQTILSLRSGSSGLCLYCIGGELRISYIGVADYNTTLASLVDGTQYNICMERGDDSNVRVYVDGTLASAAPFAIPTNVPSTANMYIGAEEGTGRFVAGKMDEIRWNSSALYNGDYTPSLPFPEPSTGPTITSQPSNVSVNEGSNATFTVAATGSGTLTYQWFETTAGALSGEINPSLTITSTTPAQSGNGYFCRVTDSNGSTDSDTATLTVTALTDAPTIYRQPVSQTVNSGETVSFSCQAVGEPTLSFQWYETTAGLLAGETGTVLSFTAQNAQNGNGYYCIVTAGNNETTTSNTATLSVGDQILTITHQPVSTSVTEGQIASFTVRAVGTGTLTYQWKDQNGNIAGAINATYAFSTQLSDNGNTYECEVTDDNGSELTNTVALTVYENIGPEPTPDRGSRTALVWSFDNGTFTWQDASHSNSGTLDPIVCMNYGFDIGWQIRWQKWLDDGTTWADLLTAQTRWNDLYSAADEKFLFWLSENNLLKSDQLIERRNGKDYFVERRNVDFKDLTNWTSDSWKFLRQFVFHAQSDIDTSVNTPNTFNFTVGWGSNLMDDANWEPTVVVSLNSPDRAGDYKADLRTTGRYLSIRMDFEETNEITMTGGDMDMELTHGR